ncbi:MAG: acetolactate synthase small subunit [Planctomycetota bacterium]
MRQVLSALVTNEPGVLASVAGMFAARGFNIDSLVVGRTEDPEMSRMTVVVEGDANVIAQVREQLAKLVPVARVRNLTETAYVERDLAMIKVDASAAKRNEVIELVNMFRGKIVDVAPDSMTIELSGREEKVEAMINLLRDVGIRELTRTGVIAVSRGVQIDSTGAMADTAPRVRSLDNDSADALPPS